MKTVLLIALFAINSIPALAGETPCLQPNDRACDRRFPYKYCDGNGNIAVFCTSDPYHPAAGMSSEDATSYNNEWSSFRRPVKLNIPVCITFDPDGAGSGPVSADGTVCGNGLCLAPVPAHQIYRKSDMLTDLQRVMDEWNCICGAQSDPCDDPHACKIPLTFVSKNVNEFKDPRQPSANTFDMKKPTGIMNSDCRIDCQSLAIYLNNTNEFTGKSTGVYSGVSYEQYSYFFLSGSHTDDNWTEIPGLYPNGYNLVNIVSYEVAKIFNVDTHNRSDLFDPCWDQQSAYSAANETTMDQITTNPLTDGEKCMFMKLYCPGEGIDAVEEDTYNDQAKLVPNPAKDVITLQLPIDLNELYADIEIVNAIGEKIGSYSTTTMNHTIQLNISGFSAGAYYCIIKTNNTIFVQKFVVLP